MKFTIYKTDTGQILETGSSEYPERKVLVGMSILEGVESSLDGSDYVDDGRLVSKGDAPSQSHVFDYATKEWVDPRTLADLRATAHASINAWRDAQESFGTLFEHAGRMWDCNPAAKDKLQSTAAMPAVPPGFFWTDASEPVNQDVPMDIEAVRALNEAHKLAYFQRGLQIHVRQREMKAALDAMDAEQLAAFVPGWPPESN